MSYLVDTHALLWFFAGSDELSLPAREVMLSPKNRIYVSIASIWEISIKVSIGKLRLGLKLEELKKKMDANQFEILAIEFEHLVPLPDLETFHKDPFDRLMICQARTERLAIISKDVHFRSYRNIRVYW